MNATSVLRLWLARCMGLMVCLGCLRGAILQAGPGAESADAAVVQVSSDQARDAANLAVDADDRPDPNSGLLLSPTAIDSGSIYDRSLWERGYLTGNWLGFRERWAERGVTFDLSSTQFYQGVTTGGLDRIFEYSGRNDYLFHFDAERSGLWSGLYIDLHGETRYGTDINNNAGPILSPPNIAMLFPLPEGNHTALTSVKLTQYLSESLVVFGGKFNMLDELIQTFGGGRGVDAFMNTGLVFPVVLDRTVPYSTLGAGGAIMQGKRALFTLMAFDTHNTPTTTGFESFFTNGVTVLSKLEIPVSLGGLPGHQGVEGTYSTGTYASLRTIPYIDVNGLPSATFVPVQGSWSVFYMADQALYVDPNNPERSWGVFTNIGWADNDPSPIRFSASVGVGGSSPLVSRPLDTFGIGYSHVAPSQGMQQLDPVLVPLRSDNAVELYYNMAVAPWLRVTPDLQILVPDRIQTLPPNVQPVETTILFGVRAKMVF
ncbi:MAG: carbohydrate porin [Planctomycetes bacterium]|nr:carbohydrate porin [Planctomycetota bacterium]